MTKIPDSVLDAMIAQDKKKDAELAVSLDDVNAFGDKESIIKMYESIRAYNRMLKEKITFINEDLTRVIPFTRENLYLICAFTGSGKSTICANVSYPLYQQQKKTLVISNEESQQDVLFRIACLELGYNFNDYKKGNMPIQQQKEIIKLFPKISQYVKVLDVNYKDGLTTKLEGVQNALVAVQKADYSCAMIDYYQLIKYSLNKPQANTYEVLNDFRSWLGRYIKDSNIPIVLFAQLHSLGKRSKDIDTRIKDCPVVSETATVIIEAIPDFEAHKTDLIIVKDRFGCQGKRVEVGFDHGRFVPYTEDFKKKVLGEKITQIENKLAEEKDDNVLDA